MNRFSRVQRLVVAILGVTALGGLYASSAYANSFDPNQADSSYHDFYFGTNLTNDIINKTQWARANALDAATDMSTGVVATYNASVDVYVVGTYSPPPNNAGDYAFTFCRTYAGSRCDQNQLTYNMNNPHPDYYALACHEIGHSVGLGHYDGTNNNQYSDPNKSCMRGTPDWHFYSSHDKDHINGTW